MMLHSKFNSGELRKKNCVIGIVVKTTIYLEKNKMIQKNLKKKGKNNWLASIIPSNNFISFLIDTIKIELLNTFSVVIILGFKIWRLLYKLTYSKKNAFSWI